MQYSNNLVKNCKGVEKSGPAVVCNGAEGQNLLPKEAFDFHVQ